MATVGRNFAVAQIGPICLTGLAGFGAWLAVHIAPIAGVRTRWLVLSTWVSGYLFRDRPVRLIALPRAPIRSPGRSNAPRRPTMNQQQFDKVKFDNSFIAALDDLAPVSHQRCFWRLISRSRRPGIGRRR